MPARATARIAAAALLAALIARVPAEAADMCAGWDQFSTAAAGRMAAPDASLNDRGFLGLYQFGPAALTSLGYMTAGSDGKLSWTGKNGARSERDFLANAGMQAAAYGEYAKQNWAAIGRLGLDKYVGSKLPDGSPITQSGLIMACQVGCGRLANYFEDGMLCSRSTSDPSGVCVEDYVRRGSGYDVSSITGSKDVSGQPGGDGRCLGPTPVMASRSAAASATVGQASGSSSMSSRICDTVMPMIEQIDCSRFPAAQQSFCSTYRPYLMNRQQCQDAEGWAKEQVESSGGGSSDNPPKPQAEAPDPKEGKEAGGGAGGPIFQQGVVDNGDDSEPGSPGSTPISPVPSTVAGGGAGTAGNQAVSGNSYSGGPESVGKIRAGNWAAACKKQTDVDGSGSWSYVLWCSQLQADPPRRESGADCANCPTYNGSRPTNPANSSNATEPKPDNQCFQRLQALGVQASFGGYNAASHIEPRTGKRCFVATAVSVKKWSTVSMPKIVVNMNCPLAERVEKWVKGLGISQLDHYGSTSCRAMNGNRDGGTHLSMHSYGDAFDVASMDGQKFDGWSKAPPIQTRAWQAACGIFDRVLGPGYYANKWVHFHVEQGHGGTCNR